MLNPVVSLYSLASDGLGYLTRRQVFAVGGMHIRNVWTNLIAGYRSANALSLKFLTHLTWPPKIDVRASTVRNSQ